MEEKREEEEKEEEKNGNSPFVRERKRNYVMSTAFASFPFVGESDLGGKMMNIFEVNTSVPSFIHSTTAPQRLTPNPYLTVGAIALLIIMFFF